MKIAMMVRGYLPSPRPDDMVYAPIDLAVHIAEGLAKKGHDVHYYGPQGTKVKGATVHTRNLRPFVKNQEDFRNLKHDTEKLMHYAPELWDKYLAVDMFKRAQRGEFDLLFFEHAESALVLSSMVPAVPVVYTLNDPVYEWYKELFEMYQTPNQYYISISNNQRRDAPDLNYADTVYNGIDTKMFKFSKDHEDYLLFAGRINPEKGVKEAIKVAKETGDRLLIIGPVDERHEGYFNQYIKPQLDDKILYLGFVERKHLVRYFQKAKAFLMPISWEEPFGLTMIESMACGTPVVGFRRGSIPEVVDHGKTGYVVDSSKDMVEALGKIDKIDRKACREHVRKNFSVEQMVESYEKSFKKIRRHHRQHNPTAVLAKSLRRLPRRLRVPNVPKKISQKAKSTKKTKN